MSYKVVIHPTGHRFEAGSDESLLEAALFQDIALPYGCQSGGCGACRARLLEGEVDYPYDPPALTPAGRAAGEVLLCQAQARSDLVLQVEELPQDHAIPVRNLPVRVESRQNLCHDVMQLMLRLPKGEAFEYLAGQYVDILLRDGRRRSFSIANAPTRKGYLELHLRLVPGGHFTDYVFNQMPARSILRIEGPLGAFYLRQGAGRPLLLMAGGTGLAPIKAMLEQCMDRQQALPVALYWGVRSKTDLYLHDQLMEWAQACPWLSYTPVLSAPAPADDWQGETGLVHEIVAAQLPNIADYDVYMSGPPPMIEAGKKCFEGMGLDADHMRFDAFDYAYETWPEREAIKGD